MSVAIYQFLRCKIRSRTRKKLSEYTNSNLMVGYRELMYSVHSSSFGKPWVQMSKVSSLYMYLHQSIGFEFTF